MARAATGWFAQGRQDRLLRWLANDYAWLALLFEEAASVPRFRLESLRSLLTDEEAARRHAAKDAALIELASGRHRASGIAQVLRNALLRVKDPSQIPQAADGRILN